MISYLKSFLFPSQPPTQLLQPDNAVPKIDKGIKYNKEIFKKGKKISDIHKPGVVVRHKVF
jgi:hypothetical protein